MKTLQDIFYRSFRTPWLAKNIKYHRGIKILQKKKEKIVTLGLRLKSHHFSLVIINI